MTYLQRKGDGVGELQSTIDRLLGDIPFPFQEAPMLTRFGAMVPPLDLYERAGRYILEMVVPGYKKDDIEIEATGNSITITGSSAATKDEGDTRYHHREIRRNSFCRTVTLPQDVDTESVHATVDKGILTVTIAPVKPIAPKKVEITER